jgi:hypothetical protein
MGQPDFEPTTAWRSHWSWNQYRKGQNPFGQIGYWSSITWDLPVVCFPQGMRVQVINQSSLGLRLYGTIEEALTDYYGEWIRVGQLEYYPLNPKISPRRRYECRDPVGEYPTVYQDAVGWYVTRTGPQYPTIREALEAHMNVAIGRYAVAITQNLSDLATQKRHWAELLRDPDAMP